MDSNPKISGKRFTIIVVATAVFMWLLLYAPTPFVIYEPGIAVLTEPMVSIGTGTSTDTDKETLNEEGAFLLTTVKLTDANYWRAIRSNWDPNTDFYSKKSIFGGYTEEEYIERSSVIMIGSQNNAIEAAYRYANIPYKQISESIAVSGTQTQTSKHENNGLQTGDRVVQVEKVEGIKSFNDIMRALQGKQSGDMVSLTVTRKGSPVQISIPLGSIDETLATEAQLSAALGGVAWTELRSLMPEDELLRLNINAGAIGGPSAGLMFALQSLDLLSERNLTGGIRVAGTGTIQPDGTVGAIGGVAYKIVAAEEEGAQLFLAPAANYKEASEKAVSIGSSMVVVSVSNLQESVSAITSYADAH